MREPRCKADVLGFGLGLALLELLLLARMHAVAEPLDPAPQRLGLARGLVRVARARVRRKHQTRVLQEKWGKGPGSKLKERVAKFAETTVYRPMYWDVPSTKWARRLSKRLAFAVVYGVVLDWIVLYCEFLC